MKTIRFRTRRRGDAVRFPTLITLTTLIGIASGFTFAQVKEYDRLRQTGLDEYLMGHYPQAETRFCRPWNRIEKVTTNMRWQLTTPPWAMSIKLNSGFQKLRKPMERRFQCCGINANRLMHSRLYGGISEGP